MFVQKKVKDKPRQMILCTWGQINIICLSIVRRLSPIVPYRDALPERGYGGEENYKDWQAVRNGKFRLGIYILP